jgi:hypothetical protein
MSRKVFISGKRWEDVGTITNESYPGDCPQHLTQ